MPALVHNHTENPGNYQKDNQECNGKAYAGNGLSFADPFLFFRHRGKILPASVDFLQAYAFSLEKSKKQRHKTKRKYQSHYHTPQPSGGIQEIFIEKLCFLPIIHNYGNSACQQHSPGHRPKNDPQHIFIGAEVGRADEAFVLIRAVVVRHLGGGSQLRQNNTQILFLRRPVPAALFQHIFNQGIQLRADI